MTAKFTKNHTKNETKKSDSTLGIYFNQIKSFPLLDFKQELELSKRIQKGDKTALQKLVNSNLRLVIKIARAYVSSETQLMDLIQEGNMGLMHAAKKYDFRKNVRFCTYSSYWIRQYIHRYLSNKSRIMRIPQRQEHYS